jgi:hypothetical protein
VLGGSLSLPLRLRVMGIWIASHGLYYTHWSGRASTGNVKHGSFQATVHRELSVALVKGNHGIFRAGIQLYTRASGRARLPGLPVPTADIE